MTTKTIRDEALDLDVKPCTPIRIRKCLKDDFGMSYRLKRPQYGSINTDENLVGRQAFTTVFLDIIERGLEVVNIDESMIEKLDF